MSSNQRRERINNSKAQLPGDPQRAQAEENEDFDAGDTGNFGASVSGLSGGNEERRQQINQSKEQLQGDLERGDDDRRVDEFGEDAPKDKAAARIYSRKPSSRR